MRLEMRTPKVVILLLLAMIVSLWLISGCSSKDQAPSASPQRACLPTERCFKKVQQTYKRNLVCAAAKADAAKRYGRLGAELAEIYVADPFSTGYLRCR